MKTLTNLGWIYYIGDTSELIEDKVGKWMYFFKESDNVNYVKKLCADAVEQGIVSEAKHTNPDSFGLNPYGSDDSGVCCFYLNCDDIDRHKKVLSYFIKNNMIQKTKTGKLYNISFKLDNQTRAMEYGDKFKGKITLSDFIDLETGEWII